MSDSSQGSGLFVNIILVLVTAVGSIAGTVYLNKPQEGSPNYRLMEKFGLVEEQAKEPPELNCESIRQDTPYSEVRQQLKDCLWYANKQEPVFILDSIARNVATKYDWTEVLKCSVGTSTTYCDFLFIKPTGERLIVFTSGQNYTLDSYATYWESENPDK